MHNVQCNQRFLCGAADNQPLYACFWSCGKDDADDGEADGDEADADEACTDEADADEVDADEADADEADAGKAESDTDKAGIKDDALERQSNYSQWWWEGISEVLMIPQLLFKPSRACW